MSGTSAKAMVPSQPCADRAKAKAMETRPETPAARRLAGGAASSNAASLSYVWGGGAAPAGGGGEGLLGRSVGGGLGPPPPEPLPALERWLVKSRLQGSRRGVPPHCPNVASNDTAKAP